MGNVNTGRRCPHCAKVGTRIADQVTLKGDIVMDSSYCGACGKNWPAPGKAKLSR